MTDTLVPVAAEEEAAAQTERAEVVLSTATALVIATPDDFENAARFRAVCKTELKELDEREKDITRPLLDATNRVRALFKPAKDMRARAVTAIDNGLGSYQRAVEARQREEARLAEAARRKALEEEAIARAAELEADGDDDRAERVILAASVPEAVPPPILVETATAKTQGLATKKKWKWRVLDEALVTRPYLMLNDKLLDAKARTEKANARVPGIEFYEDFEFASSSR